MRSKYEPSLYGSETIRTELVGKNVPIEPGLAHFNLLQKNVVNSDENLVGIGSFDQYETTYFSNELYSVKNA